MKWLGRLLGRSNLALDARESRRLAHWQAARRVDLNLPLSHARLVVVDVESSGLDLNRDRLISIGAVAIEGGRIVLADTLDVVLQQPSESSRDNILIHGIGAGAQLSGVRAADALLGFLEWVGNAPLLAFHADFDQGMVDKSLRATLGVRFNHEWADLARIAPAVCPEWASRCKSLDQWTAKFGISNFARHSALADALATAQLFQALRPRLESRRLTTFRALQSVCPR